MIKKKIKALLRDNQFWAGVITFATVILVVVLFFGFIIEWGLL